MGSVVFLWPKTTGFHWSVFTPERSGVIFGPYFYVFFGAHLTNPLKVINSSWIAGHRSAEDACGPCHWHAGAPCWAMPGVFNLNPFEG